MKHRVGYVASLVGALAGVGAGGFIASFVKLPVSPDQLAGVARTQGFNPRQDIFGFALLVLGALAGAAIARRWRGSTEAAARVRSLPWQVRFALAACLALAAMAAVLGVSIDLRYLVAWACWLLLAIAVPLSRATVSLAQIGLATASAHALTLWVFLAAPGATLGLSPIALGALLLALSLLEGYWLGGRDLERGAPNLAAAALAFPLAFWSRRTDTACLLGALAAALAPIAAVALAGVTDRLRTWQRAFTRTVFLPGSIVALAAAASLHAPPIGNFFEDGHYLLPASEYLRGELPYRDILPGHGLISDGVLQTVALSVFGDDYHGYERGLKVAGVLFWPAIYAVGAAATGSAAFGFWGAGLSFFAFPQFAFFRVITSLFCLALASRAARTGRPGAWLLAGAAIPISMLFAVEFTVYAGAAAAAALAISRGRRLVNLGRFLAGGALSAVAIATVFAGLRILGDFFYCTFVILPRLLPGYVLGKPTPPAALGPHLQDILAFGSIADADALYYWILLAALVLGSSFLLRAPAVGSRGRDLLPILAWFGAATLSVIERHHFGYPLFVAQIAVLLIARWVKGHRPWASARGLLMIALLSLAILAQRPLVTVSAVVFGLANSQPPPGVAALSDPPRARGVLFPSEATVAIRTTGEFLRSGALAADETWLDFSNAPLLYYLFNRDCPIRYYEVPYYETRSAQQEVIAAVTRNRRVRGVLLHTGLNSDWIDGIANEQRARLVFQFILERFEPAFKKNGVEFWVRRRDDPSGERR